MSSEPDLQAGASPQTNPFREPIVKAEEVVASPQRFSAETIASSDVRMGRLHPLSLAFEITSHVRSLLIPAIIAIFSAAQGSVGGLVFAGVVFIPTLIHSVVRYFSLRYRIQDAELIVTEGLLFRRIRTVPVSRIQNVNLLQNVAHRLFGVAEVRIETASGTEPEATLRVLSLGHVERLRANIFKSQQAVDLGRFSADVQGSELVELVADELLAIPTSNLLRAGLASNKGTLLLGVLIGVYFQFDDQIDAMIDFEKLVRLFAAQATTQGIIVVGIIAVVAALLLFRLLGMAWFVLRFFGYQLTRQGDDLRIQCGLLTKISATIPRPRIQFISIQRNLFQRWMKLASIRIETAGGSGGEDSAKTVSSRWFVPVLAENQVASLLDQLRPGLSWSEDALDWKQVSPLAPRRLARLAVLASIAIGLGGLAISQPWGAFIGLAALPVLIWLAIKKSHARRYARTRQGVVYRSGIFNRKTSMTFFEKIQTVRLDESPFDRRWGMATLCVDTAAAGPAEHHIHVHYLTGDFAREEYDAIVAQSSSEVPVFG